MHFAIENFKQAEIELAEKLAPVTYRWAKRKIYEDRKIILNPKSNEKEIEDASDDASAASAQLLSIVRKNEKPEDKNIIPPTELIDKNAIDNLVNEGGPVI